MERLPSDFGRPAPFTDYTQPTGGTANLWDTSRPKTPYHGHEPLWTQGGSLRAEGKGPFSEYKQDCSNDGFWNNAANISPQPGYSYGPGGQGGMG